MNASPPATPPGGTVQLAIWNVNSLRVQLPQVLAWLGARQPEVLALQETKLESHRFPEAEFAALGYHAVWSGQKTSNGVALPSRHEPQDVQLDIPGHADDQRRAVAATIRGVRVAAGGTRRPPTAGGHGRPAHRPGRP